MLTSSKNYSELLGSTKKTWGGQGPLIGNSENTQYSKEKD